MQIRRTLRPTVNTQQRSSLLNTGPAVHRSAKEMFTMLHYAVVFFVIALIAAVLGFGGIAAGAAGIAKILFVVFLIMAVASFLFGLVRGR